MLLIKKWTYLFSKMPTVFSLFAGSVLVVWQGLSGSIPPSVQMAFFIVFLFVAGIPHGAVDHLVEAETAKRQQKIFRFPRFILKYVGIMLFYTVAWYFLPSLSLLFFLVISAWHFGETDIEKAPSTALWHLARFTFGSFVILLILLNHVDDTTPILNRISQKSDSVMSIWAILSIYKTVIWVNSFVISASFALFAYIQQPVYIDKRRYSILFLLLILTCFLPLLPAFALYFGGWHALSSFKMTHEYLVHKGDFFSPTQKWQSVFTVWKKTLFFTMLAFLSFVCATYYWLHFLKTWDPLPLLFIFLSLITLPHFNVMRAMNKYV